MDLQAALPELIPQAIAWAEGVVRHCANDGRSLGAAERSLARQVGVRHPERIRIVTVDSFPLPTDRPLAEAAAATGFLDATMAGLTLGHTVFIRRDHATPRLLSHEFRHVHQYERAGSIAEFLPRYLRQVVASGYAAAAYEVDARAHERDRL